MKRNVSSLKKNLKKSRKNVPGSDSKGGVGNSVVREIYTIGSSVLHYIWDSEMKQFGRKLTELWPKEVFGLKDPYLIFGFWVEKES